MTTNSGRRVLIQITFDVMFVCKPLLSTFALKRRGVTVIFNHDYDCIIFPNETLNVTSRNCHSHLHITLANGIPYRKAMVMAGGNVADDVDEEVNIGDSAEGQEAQEASAGDRRAIADEGQARQLDTCGETRAARTLRIPEPPTDAARMVHNTTHVPFRDWYPFCVASRGRSSPHRRIVVNNTADTLPKFQADYMFTRTVAESRTQPCVTFVENAQWYSDQLHVRKERWIRGREEENPETLRSLWCGFLNPVILQCDKEMSIIDVFRKVARERKARTVVRFAPETSIRETCLSKQYTGTYKDSHDAIRDKS